VKVALTLTLSLREREQLAARFSHMTIMGFSRHENVLQKALIKNDGDSAERSTDSDRGGQTAYAENRLKLA